MKDNVYGLKLRNQGDTGRLESSRKSYEQARIGISERIRERVPFSLIRIGDGESVILGWEKGKSSDELESHLRLWFANYNFADHELSRLRKCLLRAIKRATIIGVPTTRQVALHRRYEKSYSSIERLLRWSGMEKRLVVDAAIHRFMHLSGDIVAFLRESEFIGLVTCRHVTSELGRALNPKVLAHYLIPAEAELEFGGNRWGQWYPCRYRQLLREIHVPYRGAPFLVGGGLMGKLLCDEIRLRGGTAIDIGSVFDGWAGMRSRAYQENNTGELYELEYANKISQLSNMDRLERLASVIGRCEPGNTSLYIYEPC